MQDGVAIGGAALGEAISVRPAAADQRVVPSPPTRRSFPEPAQNRPRPATRQILRLQLRTWSTS